MSAATETLEKQGRSEALTRKWQSATSDLLIDLHDAKQQLSQSTPDDFDDMAPGIDRLLSGCYADAEGLMRLSRAQSPSRYDRCDVLAELRRWSPSNIQAIDDGVIREAKTLPMCDVKQVIACLELLCKSVDRRRSGGFRLDWFPDDTIPTLMAQAVRGARFTETVGVTAGFRLSWEEFRDLWAAATNGGDLSRPAPHVLALPFRGPRFTAAGLKTYERAEAAMISAVFALRPWHGAYGAADTGYVSLTEGLRLYKKQVNLANAAIEEVRELLIFAHANSEDVVNG